MVFFEVMEINGRYEAVKMLLPTMIEENIGDETWSNEIRGPFCRTVFVTLVDLGIQGVHGPEIVGSFVVFPFVCSMT